MKTNINLVAFAASAAILAISATTAGATASIGGSDGFTPTTTINFEQAADGSNIDTYYASQGVTFSSLFQDSAYSGFFTPDLSGGVAANFPTPNPAGNAADFVINFTTPVTNAAFATVTDYPATFTSFLGGVAVESVTYSGGYQAGADIVSFTSSNFDSIHFSGTTDHAAIIDNLGFTGGAVPEPATWAMMLVGLGGIGATMRSRRKVTVSAVA